MEASSVDYTTTNPNETLKEAFNRLCDEDAYERGHSSYSGGINTCTGIRLATPKVMTLSEAERFGGQRLDLLSKWADAEGIPLATETPAQYGESTTHVTKPIRLTGAAMRRVLDGGRQAVYAEVARALKVTPKEIQTLNNAERSFAPTVRVTRWTTAVQATKGKAVTRYFIVTPQTRMMPEWSAGYETQAKARAALKTGLENGTITSPWDGGSTVEASIIAMTRREDDSNLVTGTATPKEIEIVAQRATVAKIIKPATVDRTKRSGWYIYGWAAS